MLDVKKKQAVIKKFQTLSCEYIMKTIVLILLKYLNIIDFEKLLYLIRQKHYKSKIFNEKKLYNNFSKNKNLKNHLSEKLYQYIIILLIHFVNISETGDFEMGYLLFF